MPPVAQTEFEADVKIGADAVARVALKGRLSARTVADCWKSLEDQLRPHRIKILEAESISAAAPALPCFAI
jgi:hypothetical protein